MVEISRHLVAALVVGLAAIGLLACGSDDSTTDGTTSGEDGGLPVHFVTDEDIDAQEPGSPERALLEWWQSFQFSDAVGVEALTSKETLEEVGAKNLSDLVKIRGRGLQGIEVLGSTESGDLASVRAGLLTFQPEEPGDPPPEEPTGSTPTTFELADEGGKWLFNSPEYLQPMIDSLRASEEEQQGQQGSGGGDSGSGDSEQK